MHPVSGPFGIHPSVRQHVFRFSVKKCCVQRSQNTRCESQRGHAHDSRAMKSDSAADLELSNILVNLTTFLINENAQYYGLVDAAVFCLYRVSVEVCAAGEA